MAQEELRDYFVEAGYEDVLLFEDPSYETACVGMTDDGRAVYDYDKMVQYLIDTDGMEYDEAVEFIQYNTIRSLPYYENAPVIVNFFMFEKNVSD